MTTSPILGMDLPDGTDVVTASQLSTALTKVDSGIGFRICTSTTRPATPYIGQSIYETDTRRKLINMNGTTTGWRTLAADSAEIIGTGTLRADRPVTPYGQDTAYSAFPSVAALLDGSLIMVYRQGTDHSVSRDGVVKKATSTDQGRTWTAPVTIASAPAGTDLRDPCVSLSRDGAKLYLTYFKGTTALAAAGVFFRSSTDGGATWGTEVRIDALPYAASSAPAIELDNGTLVVPYYGRSGAETWDSVWTGKSTDGGATWPTNTRILNGQTATNHYQEPWAILQGQTAVMTYRHGTAASIGVTASTDNTVNWSGAFAAFAGTGRPMLFWVNELTLGCIYRRLSNGDSVMRKSLLSGPAFWFPERLVEPALTAGSIGMNYAGADRVTASSNIVVLATETSSTNSRIYITYAGLSGASTPRGSIPADSVAASSNLDTLIHGTSFDQASTTLGYPWTVMAGAVTVVNGEVKSASADNVPDLIRVCANVNDVEIEADIINREAGSAQSGSAIIFRMIDASNYLMFTVETAGVNYRLYKVVGGVATQLAIATPSPFSFPFNAWQTYKVIARGNLIQCFIGGVYWVVHYLSGGDYTTFSSGKYVGVKLNSQTTNEHACRRFVVRG